MKSIYYRYILILLSIFLGSLVLMTPKVQTDETEFSANRVAEDIKVISEQPHMVDDAYHSDVRSYLYSRLEELGMNPQYKIYNQTDPNHDFATITNVVGTLEGANDSYILLVAHYDSAPGKRIGENSGSFGAADDGYGLSTILEIINVLEKQGITRENGVKVLFTDGEEIELYGSTLAAQKEQAFFSDVAYVINVEARGVKGPPIMFETSADNLNVINLYKEAYMPVSFSLAGDVYQKMPNSTDFTPITGIGVQGINIAVLDNLDYYHTPQDNYDNINLNSIQHYGAQLYPVVKEFVTNPMYSDVNVMDSSQNAIYFSFLPDVFIVYSVSTQIVLTIIALVLFIAAIVLNYMDKDINLKKVFVSFGIFFIGAIILAIIGIIISIILGAINGIPFSVTYMPKISGAFIIFFIVMLLEIILFIGLNKKFTKSYNTSNSIFFGALLFNVIYMIIFSFVLMGGSYLFTLPVMLVSLMSIISYLVHKADLKHNIIISRILMSQNIIWPIVLFTPILYLLYLALTIGALGITMLFAAFPLSLAISSFFVAEYK